MTILANLFAILLIVLMVIGLAFFLECIVRHKGWSRHNKRQALERYPEWWGQS